MRGFSIIAAILAGFMVTPASATTLVADSGWQNDQTNAAGIPSANSSWDFTLAGNGLFSVTDCCAPGDIFTLSGGATGLTTYYAGLGTDVQASGAYGSYWTDASFSKIAVALGAGTYSISIAGDCGAGWPRPVPQQSGRGLP